MKNWVLYWLGFSFFVVIICVIIIIKTFINVDNNDSIQETEEYLYSTFEDRYELIQKVCEKNGNWNNLYVSKKFRTKYNEIDGFFGKITFDRVEVQPYNEDEYPFAFYPHIVLTQGLRKMVYVYQYKYSDDENDPGLEDILISSELELVDENGKELDARKIFTNELKSENISDLIHSYSLESGIAVTDKFHKKYPHFLDIFIHYSPLDYNKIELIQNESDLDNDVAVFNVNSSLEDKSRKYRVKLLYDDRLYLDDVEVELLETGKYKWNRDDLTINKIFYKYSNWDEIKVSDRFRKKFTPDKGVFPDIDLLDYNFDFNKDNGEFDSIVLNKTNRYTIQIRCFNLNKIRENDNPESANNKKYYLYVIIKNRVGVIDDIIYKKLFYEEASMDEIKNKFLKEHEDYLKEIREIIE